MKKILLLIPLFIFAFVFTLTGCNNVEENNPNGPHTCESVCSVCGGCLDSNCNEEACLEKCPGHQPSTDTTHKCSRVCSVCGGCLDPDCNEEACLNKCYGHQEKEPVKPRKVVGIEARPDIECLQGASIYTFAQYREVYDSGETGKWLYFIEGEISNEVYGDSTVTATGTVLTRNGTFTCNLTLIIPNDPVVSVTLDTAPTQLEYNSRGLTYETLSLEGGKINVSYQSGRTVSVDMNKDMIVQTGVVPYGTSSVEIKFDEFTASFDIDYHIMSVSEIKELTSGTYDLDCIVVGPAESCNNFTNTLVIKDIVTDDYYGILYSGCAGANNAPEYVNVAKGDRILCTVQISQFTTDVSNTARAGMRFLQPVSQNSQNFISSLEIVSHNNNVLPSFEEALTITTQDEFRSLILSKTGFFKLLKLEGVNCVYSSSYCARIFIGNTVQSYADQVVRFRDGDSDSPCFRINNMNLYFENGVDDIFDIKGSNKYADPMMCSKDVYGLYIGGDSWYETFVTFGPEWLKTHDCDSSHIVSNPTSYVQVEGKWYGKGKCVRCQEENVLGNALTTTSASDIWGLGDNKSVSNFSAIFIGFAGEYQKEVSTKANYPFFTDGHKLATINSSTSGNLPSNMRVEGYSMYVDDHKLEIGDTIFFPKAIKRTASGDFLGYMGTNDIKAYVGEKVTDLSSMQLDVSSTYTLGQGTAMISGGSETQVHKIIATKENPIYISGYIDETTGKNMITYFAKDNKKINETTLAGNDKTNMTYTAGSYNRYLSLVKELFVLNLGEEFMKTNFECFKDNFDGNLDCTQTVLGTYAFEGEFYCTYRFYGNTYVQKVILPVGNTLKLIEK